MRAALLTLLLAGCASVPAAMPVRGPVTAPMVAASAETDPVDSTSDAADDPAIWRNRANPAASLVIGTDKQVGIHVYDLKGKRLSFTPAARLNNVDLRDMGPGRVIVADAMFCQRELCQSVLNEGGHYLLVVKENQPTLLRDVQAAFASEAAFSPLRPARIP